MFSCPIDYITDNLIFCHDKSCWAVYELNGYIYDMLSNSSKVGVLDRLALFLSNITSEADIMMIPVVQDVDRNFDAMIAGLNKEDPLYETAKYQANATRDYLKQKDNDDKVQRSNDYRTFFVCKLEQNENQEVFAQLRDSLSFIFGAVTRDLSAFMTADASDIAEPQYQAAQRAAWQLQRDQSQRIRMAPVDANTIQWLMRRMTYRGTGRNVPITKLSEAANLELAGKKFRRPHRNEIINMVSGEIYQEKRYLRIEHADGATSYQTFLAITALPPEQLFPGGEWIYRLQQEPYNAEIHLHIRAIEYRNSLKKIDDKRREAKSQESNIAQAHEAAPVDLYESMRDIEHMEAELKANRAPLLDMSAVICLADTEPEKLMESAKAVRASYTDDRFLTEQPMSDQLALFFQCMPATSFQVKDFIQRLPPQAAASGIFGASRELGSRNGHYIGTVGPELKRIFEDFRQACLHDISACMTLFGEQGYGKSFTANLLLYLSVMYYGAYGLIIDPKGERSHWPDKLNVLKDYLSLVTLTAEPKFAGTLDPFNIYKNNIHDACELAINVLAELFDLRPKDIEYIALLDACDRIKSEPDPSMLTLARMLETFAEDDSLSQPGKLLARQIRLQQKSGMARLLIGDGTEQAITLDNRLNILQIQNMALPSADTKKEDYTQEETISSVLMMVLASFCKDFVHSHPNRFKMVLVDESWFMTKTPEGAKLIEYMARNSRSLYCSIILNGHTVNDLPNAGVRNAITYKMCFHVKDVEEAKRMLDYLQLDPSPENIGIITNLGNHQALYQDRFHRVGVVTFDYVFEDLREVFSTRPKDTTAEAQAAAAREEGRQRA